MFFGAVIVSLVYTRTYFTVLTYLLDRCAVCAVMLATRRLGDKLSGYDYGGRKLK